jgi:hypothetical protein
LLSRAEAKIYSFLLLVSWAIFIGSFSSSFDIMFIVFFSVATLLYLALLIVSIRRWPYDITYCLNIVNEHFEDKNLGIETIKLIEFHNERPSVFCVHTIDQQKHIVRLLPRILFVSISIDSIH